MSIIGELEQEQVARLSAGRDIPDFGPGDTLRVLVKVVEGTRERVQAFEGVCIGRKNAGLNSAFTVRKISYGEGVERVFPLYSPRIDGIEVMRRGKVRRAKLYYLRGRTGKRARIVERATVRPGATKPEGVATANEGQVKAPPAEGKAKKGKAKDARPAKEGKKKTKPKGDDAKAKKDEGKKDGDA